MIEVEGLSKRFKTKQALADVTFTAKDGKVTGFLVCLRGTGRTSELPSDERSGPHRRQSGDHRPGACAGNHHGQRIRRRTLHQIHPRGHPRSSQTSRNFRQRIRSNRDPRRPQARQSPARHVLRHQIHRRSIVRACRRHARPVHPWPRRHGAHRRPMADHSGHADRLPHSHRSYRCSPSDSAA